MRANVYVSPDTSQEQVKSYWESMDPIVTNLANDDAAYDAHLDPRVPEGMLLVVLDCVAGVV